MNADEKIHVHFEGEQAEEEEIHSKEIRILIVEDNDDHFSYLQELIERFHYAQCIRSPNFIDARDKLKVKKIDFDCILLDIVLEGHKALGKQLLYEQKSHHIPIVVVSAFFNELDIPKVNSLAPLYKIPKPISFDPQTPIEKEMLAMFNQQILQSVQCSRYIRVLTKRNAELRKLIREPIKDPWSTRLFKALNSFIADQTKKISGSVIVSIVVLVILVLINTIFGNRILTLVRNLLESF